MLLELIFIFLLASIPACISYFLDYCFGKPGSESFSPSEIFSKYSLNLANKRVTGTEKVNVVTMYSGQATEGNKAEIEKLITNTIFLIGKSRFTWEKAFGMCIICTGFWISLIASLIFFFTIHLSCFSNFCFFLLIPIYSHLILRKI